MAHATATIIDKPAWVDLSSSDAQASRDFYSKVFGWKVEVNPDPQYGGYAIAKLGDKDAAGIGPAQDPRHPDGLEHLHRHQRHRRACEGRAVSRWDRGRAAVRRRRPGQDGGVPGPVRRVHLGLAGVEDGRLPDRRSELLRLGRAQCTRHREGHPVLHVRLRLDDEDERDGRRAAPVHRVPAGWGERRRRLGDELHGPGRGAQLLAGLLRGRRRGRRVQEGHRRGRARAAAAAGLPGRTLRDRERPAGRESRLAQDQRRADRSWRSRTSRPPGPDI